MASSANPESTAVLLELVRQGDDAARERLVGRYLPILRRWAHGRLPVRARSMADTDDLVQVSLMRALSRVDRFEVKREGAFLAYLRQILLNAVRDELRRPSHKIDAEPLSDQQPSRTRSPLEALIEQNTLELFEAALAELPAQQQEAVILRLEFGFSYQEIADAVGSPSANAARMVVSRAIVQLAEALGELRRGK